MKIPEFKAAVRQVEFSINGSAFEGHIARQMTFLDESYGNGKEDHSFELTIQQISDVDSPDDHVLGTLLDKLEVLRPSEGLRYPAYGKLIGHARSALVTKKTGERPVRYLWAEVYVNRQNFETIERSVSGFSKFKIELLGLPYEADIDHEESEVTVNNKFSIDQISFKSMG